MHPAVLPTFVTLWLTVYFSTSAEGLPAPSEWNWSFEDPAEAGAFAREQKSGHRSPMSAPLWFLNTDGVKRGRPMSAPLWFMQTELKKRNSQSAHPASGAQMIPAEAPHWNRSERSAKSAGTPVQDASEWGHWNVESRPMNEGSVY